MTTKNLEEMKRNVFLYSLRQNDQAYWLLFFWFTEFIDMDIKNNESFQMKSTKNHQKILIFSDLKQEKTNNSGIVNNETMITHLVQTKQKNKSLIGQVGMFSFHQLGFSLSVCLAAHKKTNERKMHFINIKSSLKLFFSGFVQLKSILWFSEANRWI